MLTIHIEQQEKYNENTCEFVSIPKTELYLEHSLVAVRDWEGKWKKPFLETKEKPIQELLYYIHCMCINKEVCTDDILNCLTPKQLETIVAYIQDDMTATWFSNNSRIGASNRTGEVVTAEIIYYWMVSLRVPIEMETWHLNRLLTLLKVLNIKNGGDKKMPKKEAAAQRRALNAQRKAKMRSKG